MLNRVNTNPLYDFMFEKTGEINVIVDGQSNLAGAWP